MNLYVQHFVKRPLHILCCIFAVVCKGSSTPEPVIFVRLSLCPPEGSVITQGCTECKRQCSVHALHVSPLHCIKSWEVSV